SLRDYLRVAFDMLSSFAQCFLIHLLWFFFPWSGPHPDLHSFPTRRSSDLIHSRVSGTLEMENWSLWLLVNWEISRFTSNHNDQRSEEHTSELQSRFDLVCRLLLEKKTDTKEKTHSIS